MAGERPDWTWYQDSMELVAAGRLDQAERRIAEALEAGQLWRASLLLSPTLDPLRGRPEFESLAAKARARVAARGLKPRVLIAPPAKARRLAPLVLVLHGARGNASAELERWRLATELGYFVAAAQSSQPATEDGFCWDAPRERIEEDPRAIATQLPQHARTVLAGFSQGAWVALNVALRADLVRAASVIMVGPFAGALSNLEPAWRRLRVAILAGDRDAYTPDVELLARELERRGHHVKLEVLPGVAHEYPPDFARRLPELLSLTRQASETTSSRSSSQ